MILVNMHLVQYNYACTEKNVLAYIELCNANMTIIVATYVASVHLLDSDKCNRLELESVYIAKKCHKNVHLWWRKNYNITCIGKLEATWS